MFSGILPVDKPAGWTSHDVVARVRRLLGQRQIGHAGTLDPLATGVLVLLLGKATRLSSYLTASTKEYCADVVLGATTVTDDAEAPLQAQAESSGVSRSDLERCLSGFVGRIEQRPPAYAAVRQGGEKLYVLARKGVAVDPPARQVSIHAVEIEDWIAPHLHLRVQCEAGTYIRSIARDIGAALGVGGYLHALRRISSGRLTLQDCASLEDLTDASLVRQHLLPLDVAVLDLPALVLARPEAEAVQMGQPVRLGSVSPHPPTPISDTEVRVYGDWGTLIGLARVSGGMIKPFRVFSGGMEADAGRL